MFIMVVVFPVFMSALLLVVAFIRYIHLSKRKVRVALKEIYGGLLLCMLILLYTSVVKQSVASLVCDSFDAGPINRPDIKRYLRSDLSLSCDTSTFTLLYWVSLGVLLLYSLGVPLLGGLMLNSKSDPIRFIKAGLKPNWKFWGLLGLLRKALFVIIGIIIDNAFLQAYLACWVSAISCAFSLSIRPFENNSFNMVEGSVYGLLGVTLLSSLIYTKTDAILMQFGDSITIGMVIFNGIIFSLLLMFLQGPITRSIKSKLKSHPKIMDFVPPYLRIQLQRKAINSLVSSALQKAVDVFDNEMFEWKDQVEEELYNLDEEYAKRFDNLRLEALKELRNKILAFQPTLRRSTMTSSMIENEFPSDIKRFPWKAKQKKLNYSFYDLDYSEKTYRSTLAMSSVTYPRDIFPIPTSYKEYSIHHFYDFYTNSQPPTPNSAVNKGEDFEHDLKGYYF
eukprot:NODE_2392_length_1597_cov_7.522388_g2057_i0.p1 GENE.NODE_2392_length_1597_cov_7.522388_g2057_i0~~NODE_2392_length_1597_cov_7.522388_g2057_i0.p1  ORF type:complete len:498 (+),score=61.90 NODE_2392_length_1597_cov_7.522388_g2057_i0:145-1494(+)